MPLVTGGVPQLVKQAVLRRDQPGQQGRVKADTLARFGEQLLVGDKAVVTLGQGKGALKVENLPAQRAAAGIGEVGPDFVEGHLELIGRCAICGVAVDQAPVEHGALARQQITEHAVTRLALGTQVCSGVQIATQATAARGDVEQQLQALQRQAFKAGIAALQAQAPHTAQGIGQVLARGVGQVHRGLARRDREFFTRQLAVGIKGRWHGSAGQRQAGDEATSREGHCLP